VAGRCRRRNVLVVEKHRLEPEVLLDDRRCVAAPAVLPDLLGTDRERRLPDRDPRLERQIEGRLDRNTRRRHRDVAIPGRHDGRREIFRGQRPKDARDLPSFRVEHPVESHRRIERGADARDRQPDLHLGPCLHRAVGERERDRPDPVGDLRIVERQEIAEQGIPVGALRHRAACRGEERGHPADLQDATAGGEHDPQRDLADRGEHRGGRGERSRARILRGGGIDLDPLWIGREPHAVEPHVERHALALLSARRDRQRRLRLRSRREALPLADRQRLLDQRHAVLRALHPLPAVAEPRAGGLFGRRRCEAGEKGHE